ncbi:MAG: shikimate kinase [Treponema sp.]
MGADDTCLLKAVVLIGLSRSGKTSVGERLAAILGCAFYDTDARIHVRTGLPPRVLYHSAGVQAFHDAEAAALNECIEMAGNSPAVIAAGGGVCGNAEAAAQILTIPERIFLYAAESVLFTRLTADAVKNGTYPAFLQSLSVREKTEAAALFSVLYRQRTAAYRTMATRILDTGGLTIPAAAQAAELLLK